ncbi:MAG TPA: M1 family aminopeptidase [Thermodesulfovibrionales bacterium]|nr:M1 family aminopeptidase [Thermodesulfovibrionales bacterium]
MTGEKSDHPTQKRTGRRILSLIGNLFPPLFFALCAALMMVPGRDASADAVQDLIHHEIEATISPRDHVLAVQDRITLPRGFAREFTFLLHRELHPAVKTQGVSIRRERVHGDSDAESYRVTLPSELSAFVVNYRGVIYHPIEPVGKETSRGFNDTPGIISGEGVYLSEGSYWYPVFDRTFITFSLQTELPAGWDAVSQGQRMLHDKKKDLTAVRWESPEPQEGIFVVAARFTEYAQRSGYIHAMVFLRSPDKSLADKYLDATLRYLSMYEKLIGPYPYAKFALVENFWETGFGMPSFTLLGSKVIRFPFIITSSYPHEILHSWWGNSVFPDYKTGNWSEGLTAYLADHLLKEQEGSGAEYRLTTLQKYADYVAGDRDFPLTEFRSRHSSSSEAVGYGKSLMFFHMLRRELGDGTFVKGLRDFYEKNKFRTASFRDLWDSFERVSGSHMQREFRQWVEKPGAPQLRLREARAVESGNGFEVSIVIEQSQPGEAYLVRVPVAVTMEGRSSAYETVVTTDKKRFELTLHLPARPLRVDLDPEFDVFRRLAQNEIPPAISLALGAKKLLVLLPSSAGKSLLSAYREFAKALGDSGPDNLEIRLDKEVKELPADRAVAVLGWENLFAGNVMSGLKAYDVTSGKNRLRIAGSEVAVKKHSFVFIARNPHNGDMAVAFIASGSGEALSGLGRKLPHYHKYSYLGFEGDEPVNVLKGRWPVIDSPMAVFLPGREGVRKIAMGELEKRAPLISLPEKFSKESMAPAATTCVTAGVRRLPLAAQTSHSLLPVR